MEKEKINVAEILKVSPRGMELDCTVFDNVTFDYVNTEQNRIYCKIDNRDTVWFTAKGCINLAPSAKCVIFPKGKTTWEGFHNPLEDGDILAFTSLYTTVFIYRNKDNEPKHTTSFYVGYTIGTSYCNFHIYNENTLIALNGDCDTRLATEEEKHKLFQAIKDNGYKWNDETKTLEKLIVPKFKVGDRIILKDNPHNIPSIKIKAVTKSQYILENEGFFYIDSADKKYVLENKFDITTLVPFESRVLVRDTEGKKWKPAIWGHYDVDHIDGYPYETVGGNCFHFCIPYEGNEYLLNTANDCDDFYKTWEK